MVSNDMHKRSVPSGTVCDRKTGKFLRAKSWMFQKVRIGHEKCFILREDCLISGMLR